MKVLQRIIHGKEINFVTPDEIVKLIPRPEQKTRIRADQATALGVSPSVVDVYHCPAGYSFEARRVFIRLSNDGLTTGAATFTAITDAAYLLYLRSGEIICAARPVAPNGTFSIPGDESWGEEQGPKVANGEVFQVAAYGLTQGVSLIVHLEGILTRPSTIPGDPPR